MARVVDSRWFGLAELVCAVGSVALSLHQPNLFGWPFLLMLLPWGARVLAGRFPFRPTGLEIWFVLFLTTAGIGVWAAYNPAAAWSKFWVLVGAVILYYAIINQPTKTLPFIFHGLVGFGVLLLIILLLTIDVQFYDHDFAWLDQVMVAWAAVRPTFPVTKLNLNIFGGLFALILPLGLGAGLVTYRQKNRLGVWWAALTSLLALIGLTLTSSRAAWFAVGVGLSLWVAWWLVQRFMLRTGRSPNVLFGVVAGVILLIAFTFIALTFFNRAPGLSDGSTRLTLFGDAFDLVGDFAVTGGGLTSFAGLFSRYTLVIPYFVLSYGYNFFLDVALEQGLFGLLALVMIYSLSFWRLARTQVAADDGLSVSRQAVWVSLTVVLLHSLVDDPLYAESGTPFIFLLPALAVALAAPRPAASPARAPVWGWLKPQLAGLAVIALAALSVWFWQPWRAELYANVGAVEMARHELRGFPEVRWDERQDLSDLKLARRYLNYALELDPNNRAATYRLGLIAMLEGNFAEATPYLEAALTGRAIPRGLAKTLGYSHTWLGNYERASELLVNVPEARYEMQVYSWWWGTQNRPDLAERAAEMEQRLATLGADLSSDPLTTQP